MAHDPVEPIADPVRPIAMTTSRGPGARRPALLLLALTLSGGLLLSGCGGGADSAASGTSGSDSGGAGALADAAEPASAARAADGVAFSANGSAIRSAGDAPASQAQQRSVISTGSVELTADDVADARLDVLRVMSRYGGEVTDEQTATDPSAPDTLVSSPGSTGGPVPESDASTPASEAQAPVTHTRLVLRVPSASFDRAMRDLAGIGHFVTSNRQSTDVTTQVIDVAARLQAQRRSVARVEQLLDRAQSIREIVLVEGQLTRRQSQLESLERQHAYLQSQTSLATITVDVDRRTTAERRAAEQDSDFLSGLDAGWRGLTALVGGVLTSLGVLLPFLLVGLPIGLALWWLRRRAGRRPVGVVREDVAAE